MEIKRISATIFSFTLSRTIFVFNTVICVVFGCCGCFFIFYYSNLLLLVLLLMLLLFFAAAAALQQQQQQQKRLRKYERKEYDEFKKEKWKILTNKLTN